MSGWRVVQPDTSAIGSRRPCVHELPSINLQEHGVDVFNAVQQLVRISGNGATFPAKPAWDLLPHFPLQCSCGKIDILRDVLERGACAECAQDVDVDALRAAIVAERLAGFDTALSLLLGRYGMYGWVERRRWLAYEAMAREVVSGV